jgi:hypothetical protein
MADASMLESGTTAVEAMDYRSGCPLQSSFSSPKVQSSRDARNQFPKVLQTGFIHITP